MDDKRIVVITGEASGEAHAARMITALKQLAPNVIVNGVGGDNMRAAGVQVDIDFSALAVMGLIEVIKSYRKINAIFTHIVADLKAKPPNLLVLVDYPGFNLRLATQAKKLGIPILYYISPKVWAWRPGRVQKIKQVVDRMAVLFPFEVPIYQRAGVRVSCVGHPLVDVAKKTLSYKQAKEKLVLDPDRRVIGLFPGSRYSEIKVLLPIMLQAAERIHRDHNTSIILPIASGVSRKVWQPILQQSQLAVKVVDGDIYSAISACDAIVAASGTVTLEIALLGVPHFIVYRVDSLTYGILSRFVTIPYIGLCNIVTGQPVVTELLQNDVNASRLAYELTQLLTQPDSHRIADDVRRQVLAALGPKGGAKNAARQVIAMLEAV